MNRFAAWSANVRLVGTNVGLRLHVDGLPSASFATAPRARSLAGGSFQTAIDIVAIVKRAAEFVSLYLSAAITRHAALQ